MPDKISAENLAVPYIVDECRRKIVEIEEQSKSPALPIGVLYNMPEDEEIVKLIVSIIYVESRFRPDSISKAGAYGLMQITRPAMLEAVGYCNLPVIAMEKLLDPVTNIKYGACYLHMLMNQMDDDMDNVLIVYNGGYKQLTRYLKGVSMVSETANYLAQVRRVLQHCSEGE